MKKKKLTGLRLNKKTISNLESSQIMGGQTQYPQCGQTQPHTNCCPGTHGGTGCNITAKKCGGTLPTEAYNCTVDTIDLTNCGDTDPCNSATACA